MKHPKIQLIMRPALLVLPMLALACGHHKSELDETLEWMDNTYNSHEGISGAYGHGRSAWYAPRPDKTEFMSSGLRETFTYKSCELKLKTEDLPEAQKSHDITSTARSPSTSSISIPLPSN
jgi:hypothetical protein